MATTKRGTKTSSAKRAPAAKKTVKKATSKAVKAAKPAKQTARRTPRRTTGAAKKGSPARNRTRPAQPDAIAELKADHRAVEQLFKRFERAGDGAYRLKRQLVDTMIEELSRHAEIEEWVFYPAVRSEVRGATSDVFEALEEHHVVKLVLRELEDLDSRDERFDAKVTVMIENVRHHVKEEEGELFPGVRDGLERSRLRELGEKLREAKPRVPTRPHPDSPDEPPANAIVGGAVAVLDHARTVGKKAIDRVRDEVPTL